MTRSLEDKSDWNKLFGELCNEALDAEGRQQLNEHLSNDLGSQEAYILYADLHAAMRQIAQSCDDEEFVLREAQAAIDSFQNTGEKQLSHSRESADQPRVEASFVTDAPRDPRTMAFLRPTMLKPWRRRPAIGFSVALLLLLSAGVATFELFRHAQTESAGPSSGGVVAQSSEVMSSDEMGAARLAGAVGARWAGERLEIIEGTHFAAGQRLELVEGLAEVCFLSGARVILQGPAILEIQDESHAMVPLGRIATTVPEAAPQFTLLTDVAAVTSGTAEYGIEIEVDRSVVTQVYDGVVKMKLSGDNDSSTNLELAKNQGLQIDAPSGQVKQLDQSDQLHVVRYLPRHDVQISLADIVAGGNGLGDGSAEGYHCGISLLGGKAVGDYGAPAAGDGQYHKAADFEAVDGVFIPNGERGKVQVDSIGRTFAGFPATADECWGGAIMARRPALERSLPFIRLEWHGDRTGYVNWLHIASHPEALSPLGYGLIGMHSNCGITFDLHAIRAQHPDKKVVRFRARVGNLEAKQEEYLADAWVLVDGELRYSRTAFSREQGGDEIDLPLTDRDRFLVLAVTDSGEDTAYDWVAFGDPVIETTTRLGEFALDQSTLGRGTRLHDLESENSTVSFTTTGNFKTVFSTSNETQIRDSVVAPQYNRLFLDESCYEGNARCLASWPNRASADQGLMSGGG